MRVSVGQYRAALARLAAIILTLFVASGVGRERIFKRQQQWGTCPMDWQVHDHVRRDLDRTDDPRFGALLETTSEVLQGLVRAYEHFDRKAEKAWKQ